MIGRMSFVLLLAACVLVPRPASAWGLDAHRFIMDRAIELLPPALQPYFEKRRAYIVERSVDPDLWRTIGWEEEPPNHFLDMDAYGAYPFPHLPRVYDQAVEKYGPAFVERNGLLPWRTQEFHGHLRRAFEQAGRPDPGYAFENIALFSATLAHYVSDGHVPLHAVLNYDGQLTKQRGVHGRWESDLFARYRTRLTLAPAAAKPVTHPRDAMFDILLESFRGAEPLLEADRQALGGRREYDDAYYDAFFAATRELLQRRLEASIEATAAFITGAWEAAGRPRIPPERRRAARRPPQP